MAHTTQLVKYVTSPMSELSVNLMLDDHWPDGIVRPAKVEIFRDTWNWVPQNSTLLGPLAFLRMPDGKTTLCFEHFEERGVRSGWHEFDGNWDFYTKGDDHDRRAIGNAFYEIFIASISAAARGIKVT